MFQGSLYSLYGSWRLASFPGSVLKTGWGESLATFTRKAVDFRCVIIHVINVLTLVIIVMWFNKLECNISSIPGSSTNYLHFVPCLQGILSSVEFQDTLCTCKLGAPIDVQWVSWSHKPTTANFDFGLSGTFHTSKKLFFTALRGIVYTYKFIFELTIFCWVDKVSRVHMVSFCDLIGTTRARCRKLTTFPADSTRLSPPPSLWWERAWGWG